jgi:hypothetical protein
MELRSGLSNEQVQFAKCPTGIGRAECRQLSSLERADILRGKVPACPQLRRIAVEPYRMCRREGHDGANQKTVMFNSACFDASRIVRGHHGAREYCARG